MSDWVTLRDQLNLTLRPIDEWPAKQTPHWQRERGPYSAGLKDTLQTLRRELNALRAKSIVLQIAFRADKMRLDGLPRAGATAEHPGVILAFDSDRGSLRIWFDRFLRWESNLRAIAHHLEHLRMAGLYGVGEDGQQYKGWTAIPASHDSGDQKEAAHLIYTYDMGTTARPDDILRDVDTFKRAAREALKATHPDRGGDVEVFHKVSAAVAVLNKRFGVA